MLKLCIVILLSQTYFGNFSPGKRHDPQSDHLSSIAYFEIPIVIDTFRGNWEYEDGDGNCNIPGNFDCFPPAF